MLVISDEPSEIGLSLLGEGAKLTSASLPDFDSNDVPPDPPEEVKAYHGAVLKSEVLLFDLKNWSEFETLLGWLKSHNNLLEGITSATVRFSEESELEDRGNTQLADEIDQAHFEDEDYESPMSIPISFLENSIGRAFNPLEARNIAL